MVPWPSRVPWPMASSAGRKSLIFFLSGSGPEPDVNSLLLCASAWGFPQRASQASHTLWEAGAYSHPHPTDENVEAQKGECICSGHVASVCLAL